MADITYRGNLKTAGFPLLSELFGRSVIVRNQDQNFVNGLAAKESIDSSIGIPQIYYAHNVVPTDQGYKSVSIDTVVEPAYPTTAGFTDVLTIRNDAGDSALITSDAVGNVYVMETGTTVWITPVGAPIIPGRRISVAYVSGVSYIYFSNLGCYVYDFSTNTLTLTTLTGLTAADIIGVAGNSGYLLAYSTDAIAWSSVITPTDFTPSLTSGAGGGSVEGLRGSIVTVEEVYGGLIVFATDNAVAANYSGNPRYPYSFVPIPGCGGIRDYRNVASDTGSGMLYAYTESGMQSITLRSAATVFPEVTDFLGGALLEDFNETTNELILVDASGYEIQKRVVLIADRYLVISYGVTSLTHALFYDLSYKQWGRLRGNHVDCFELLEYPSSNVEIPKKSVAFLTAGGGINVLNTDIVNSNAYGVMILGKFQYVRTRMLQLQHVEFENVNQGDTFELYTIPSLDGKNLLTPAAGYLLESTGKFRHYLFSTIALNHSILCKGAFNAVSFQLTFNTAGAR